MKEYIEKKIIRFLEELDATISYDEIEAVFKHELKQTLNELVKEKKIKFTKENGTIYFTK